MIKLIHLSLFLISFQCVFTQSKTSTYYIEFDHLVGSYQNDLNTGKLFEDLYHTKSKNDFRFFKTYSPITGQVRYKGQDFYKCALKYDLYEDNLLLDNVDPTNPYLIKLDKTLVSSFSLEDQNFVKLPLNAASFSFYKNGFFEIIGQYKEFNLFLKHMKSKKENVGDKNLYYSYTKKENILLEYKSGFYEITSKNSVLKILPERKKEIRSFYKNHDRLRSQNKTEFMKKLFSTLATSTS